MRSRFRYGLAMSGGGVLLGLCTVYGCGGSDDNSATTNVGLPNGVATRAQVLRGRYLVVAAGCSDCHAANGDNPGAAQWLAGYVPNSPNANQAFQIGPFKTYAANLTPDTTTGIGSWSAQDIFNALRNGKDPEGKYLAPPMPWPATRNYTDADLYAIAAYLKSIKSVSNAVPEPQGPIGANGKVDWSSAYQNLAAVPAYPAASENDVP